MERKQIRSLMAEQLSLRKMIAATPPEDVIDRGALQSKLDAVVAALERQAKTVEPAQTRVTFSGRPVLGTHGIYADFAMKAVSGFTDAVAAVAASLTAPLNAMGPIPNREQNQLLITNVALGSFGFELEEMPAIQGTFDGESVVAQAIERTQSILFAAIAADDDALAESASEVDRRAVDKIRSFVETLQANEALCTVSFKGRSLRFSTSSDVVRTLQRMSSSNILEVEEEIRGKFLGVLPYRRRTFEFRVEGSGDVIVGRFGPDVLQPEQANQHIGKLCTARFVVTRVGQGRPRYQLVALPDWPD